MPIEGRSARECCEEFRKHVAQIICSTLWRDATFKVRPGAIENRFALVLVPYGTSVPVQSPLGSFYLSVSQTLEAEKKRKRQYVLHTRQYWYQLHGPDPAGEPLIRWEYDKLRHDPDTAQPPRNHIQMDGKLSQGDMEPLNLKRLHVPTGFVLLEEVIRFLITDFQVQPLCRESWPNVLRKGEARFRDWAPLADR